MDARPRRARSPNLLKGNGFGVRPQVLVLTNGQDDDALPLGAQHPGRRPSATRRQASTLDLIGAQAIVLQEGARRGAHRGAPPGRQGEPRPSRPWRRMSPRPPSRGARATAPSLETLPPPSLIARDETLVHSRHRNRPRDPCLKHPHRARPDREVGPPRRGGQGTTPSRSSQERQQDPDPQGHRGALPRRRPSRRSARWWSAASAAASSPSAALSRAARPAGRRPS